MRRAQRGPFDGFAMLSPMSGRASRPLVAGAVLGVVGAIALVVVWSQAGAGRAPTARGATSAGATADDQVAALVNGVPISLARVRLAEAFSQPIGGPAAVAFGTEKAALEQHIKNELLFQEAARRGLQPDPAEVQQEVIRNQQALKEMSSRPDADPKMKEIEAALAGTPYSIENYDKSPEVFAVFERALAIGALTRQLMADVPPAAQTLALSQERVDELHRQLRASANVKILVASP